MAPFFLRHPVVVLLSCRRLLEWGADTDCKTLLGETACHLAAYRGHSDVVRHLLAAGCDLTRRNWRGNDVVDEALSAADGRSAVTAVILLSTVTGRSMPSCPRSTTVGYDVYRQPVLTATDNRDYWVSD